MDLRSQPMRSKLLALHLILQILSSSAYVFLTPAKVLSKQAGIEQPLFIDAAKHHLCLSVSRNAVSVVPPVLEVSMEIFSKMVLNLREVLKVSYPVEKANL